MNTTNSTSALSSPTSLSVRQETALETIERTMSILSVLGCLFIITSFLLDEGLRRKAFNRLLFFASFGNLLSNVATIVGTAGIRAGTSSATCKAQATFIQWFIPADCLWTFCMALNVFLTFHTSTLAVNLRKMEKWYFVLCYGVPGVPALTFLMMDVTRGTNYYGNATLWCWISKKHDSLRLLTFYGPVWVVIIVIMTLYGITGRSIYTGQVRNKLMQNALSPDSGSMSGPKNSAPRISAVADTEISQISGPNSLSESFDKPRGIPIISTDPLMSVSHHPRFIPIKVSKFGDGVHLEEKELEASIHASPSAPPSIASRSQSRQPSLNGDNRTDSNIRVTTTITSSSIASPLQAYHMRHTNSNFPTRQPSLRPFQTRVNRGARTYAQVAFLLYLVMLAVWVPGTVNRVWGVVHPNQLNFPLILAAATVLPLQGFFNTLIYLFTSRREMSVHFRRRWSRLGSSNSTNENTTQLPTSRPTTNNGWYRPESRTELALMQDEIERRLESYNPSWHSKKTASHVNEHMV